MLLVVDENVTGRCYKSYDGKGMSPLREGGDGIGV